MTVRLVVRTGHRGRRYFFSSLGASLMLHVALAAALLMIPFHSVKDSEPSNTSRQPLKIVVDGRLFYVTHLPDRAAEPEHTAAVPKPLRAMAESRLPAIATPPEHSADDATQATVPPRRFIPPAVQPSERLVIQPDSPPDIKSPDLALPTIEIWADARLPKIPKPFRAPGRDAAPIPATSPTIISEAESATPSFASPMPAAISAPAGISGIPGDALRVLAWSKNPTPPTDHIVISGGNEAPPVGGREPVGAVAMGSNPIGTASAGTARLNAPEGAGRPSPAGTARPVAPPAPAIITRPMNGNFDAVVVQSSPLDQFPEAKNLLPGRPIYTVYIPLGSGKEWAFYFSAPPTEPKRATSETRTVFLGNAPPVSAPYPYRFVRPAFGLPPGRKYVLVHGFVNESGRFCELALVAANDPEWDQGLLASLEKWEFRPATRDRIPIAVEFLLSIR